MLKKCIALLFLLCIVVFGEPNFPQLSGRVVDEVGLLSQKQQKLLSEKLAEFEKNTTAQVVVVIPKSLGGYEVADYGYKLGRHWRIGQEGISNGALLIIAPYEKKIRIEVGYGLEATLTDAKAHQIINEIILPRFKDKDVYGGIEAGVFGIGLALSNAPHTKDKAIDDKTNKERSLDTLFVTLAFILVPLLFFVLWAVKTLIQNKIARKIINGTLAGSVAGGVSWILFFILGVSIGVTVVFFVIGFLIDDKRKNDSSFGDFGGGGASGDIIGGIMDGLGGLSS